MELFFCPDIADRADAYALLAYAARQVWGLYTLPAIDRGEQGKPFFPACPQFQFNLSHSGTFALCALDNAPVGVDIEVIRPHHPRLGARICSPRELAWVEQEADKTSALCKLWVRKEARVKCDGCGLTVPLREIYTPFDDGLSDGLHLRTLYGDGWVAAVCGHSAPAPICTVPAHLLKKLDTNGNGC